MLVKWVCFKAHKLLPLEQSGFFLALYESAIERIATKTNFSMLVNSLSEDTANIGLADTKLF